MERQAFHMVDTINIGGKEEEVGRNEGSCISFLAEN